MELKLCNYDCILNLNKRHMHVKFSPSYMILNKGVLYQLDVQYQNIIVGPWIYSLKWILIFSNPEPRTRIRRNVL